MISKREYMGLRQSKGSNVAKILLTDIAVFLIGFECGRLYRRKEIQELEAAAKSVGWWNMQLEEELQELRGDEN